MNDNPGGTPNPLNPNLATGSAPTPQGPAGQRPVQQTINPVFSTPRPMNPVAPNQPMNFGATEQPTAPVVGSQAQMPAGQTPQMSQMPQAQPNDPYSPAFGMQNQPQPVAQPSIQNMANGQAFMSPQTPLNEPNDQNMNQGTVTPTSQPMMESAQVKSPKKTSKVTIILAIILL
ncbi:MAG: hypothetical protein Q4A79_03390, partial [Candidatus Saccharibacteria bacterium]|nr:hypothetical protein [Candidatus Saccharibacteria bacterium]